VISSQAKAPSVAATIATANPTNRRDSWNLNDIAQTSGGPRTESNLQAAAKTKAGPPQSMGVDSLAARPASRRLAAVAP
jgi:hypothetical protein